MTMAGDLREAEGGCWTPRLQSGGIFCSPACGCRCTRADFDKATREANELCKALGDGWTPVIWENGGWHHKAVKGPAEVSPNSSGWRRDQGDPHTYTVFIQTYPQVVVQGGTDPVEAVGLAMQEARGILVRFEAQLNEVGA